MACATCGDDHAHRWHQAGAAVLIGAQVDMVFTASPIAAEIIITTRAVRAREEHSKAIARLDGRTRRVAHRCAKILELCPLDLDVIL